MLERETRERLHESHAVRQDFYGFLASLYLYELTEQQVEAFAHLSFPQDGSDAARAYALMVEYLRHRDAATAQTLRVDYAHTFLGAGTYDKIMAPPYESVFTSEERLLMQDARDGVLAYYRHVGLSLPADNSTPEDHLGFELQFMAHLIRLADDALRAGDDERLRELTSLQSSFLRYHLENWVPEFCDAIDEFCQTDFYHGVAALTRAFLAEERATLDEVALEVGCDEAMGEIRSPWMDEPCDRTSQESVFEAVKREAQALGAAMPRNE